MPRTVSTGANSFLDSYNKRKTVQTQGQQDPVASVVSAPEQAATSNETQPGGTPAVIRPAPPPPTGPAPTPAPITPDPIGTRPPGAPPPPPPASGEPRPPVVQPEPVKQPEPKDVAPTPQAVTLPVGQQTPFGKPQDITPRAVPKYGLAKQEEGARGGAWDWIRANQPNIKKIGQIQMDKFQKSLSPGMSPGAQEFLAYMQSKGINPANPGAPLATYTRAGNTVTPGTTPAPNLYGTPGAEEWLARAQNAPMGFTADESKTGAGRVLEGYALGRLDPFTAALMGQNGDIRGEKAAQQATYKRLFGDINAAAKAGGYTYDQQLANADKAVTDSIAAGHAGAEDEMSAFMGSGTQVGEGQTGLPYGLGRDENGNIVQANLEGQDADLALAQANWAKYQELQDRLSGNTQTTRDAKAEAERLKHLYDNISKPPPRPPKP